MRHVAALARFVRAIGGGLLFATGHLITPRRRRNEKGPARLRRLFERLGGTYLKLGQLLSLQADLLPRAYCFALYDLLDSVPPVALADIEDTFRREVGRTTSEVFDRFDPSPLASASIAQVPWRSERWSF